MKTAFKPTSRFDRFFGWGLRELSSFCRLEPDELSTTDIVVREVSGVDVNRGVFSGELSDPSLVAGVLSSPSAEEIKPEEKSTSEDSSVRFADICESDILDDELMALDISVTFVGFVTWTLALVFVVCLSVNKKLATRPSRLVSKSFTRAAIYK